MKMNGPALAVEQFSILEVDGYVSDDLRAPPVVIVRQWP
jgi:hypothetical protein